MGEESDNHHDRKDMRCQRGRGLSSEALSKRVSSKLLSLTRLLRSHDRRCWRIGDLVRELLERHRCSLELLARHTNYSKSRLSEFHLTAAAFPKGQREGYTFEESLLARRIRRRLGALNINILDIRQEIRQFGLKRFRQARAHFVRKLVAQQVDSAHAAPTRALEKAGGLINRCHHADYRDIVPKLPDGSVKLFLADPPFGTYSHLPGGGYLSGRAATNGFRIDCDANTTDEALAITLPLFELCLPKLARGGCLLLFQPGCKPDRPEILEAASRNDWTCAYALTWLKVGKSDAAPCNCSEPYAVSTERILVFAQSGDRLQWHEQGLSRSDVLVFESETRGATSKMEGGDMRFGEIHMFQKPLALTEFLVRKHTFPGDLVVEPFGCSGSGVIAAAGLGRRWGYIESNDVNFAWGTRRIAQATAHLATALG